MDPNLAILSQRGLSAHVSRCCGYEFEDALRSTFPGTTLYAPRPHSSIRTGLKIKARFAHPGSFGGAFDNAFAIEQVDEHEVLLAVMGDVRDLALLGAMRDWRRKSRYAICWLHELWIEEIPRLRGMLRALEQFDLVICSLYYTAEKLREELKSPDVMYLPPGVDTLAFAPVLEPSLRPIDITNLGAIADATHKSLFEHVKQTDGFYFFDTEKGAREARSHSEHRFRYANILKRSKYFLCHFAKIKHQGPGGQLEFGLRYFEGLAAGCVVLGSRKSTPDFDMFLGWEDCVIEMPFDCPNASEIVRSLDQEANRLREISARNVRRSLEGNDHAHRWKTIVDRLGLPENYHMSRRHEEVVRKLNAFGYPTRHVVQREQQDE
ncbi:MAG: glycosyltransferase family 1 protein [Myxococcales bacterium]|nr:glycosyltransferase family 1 protein [Myxococcales bacterium]